jgi:pimeloyl-ACP methyl ester carboxylesterase
MLKMLRMLLILFIALIEPIGVLGFQPGEELPPVQSVTVIADDGLTLVGDYYLSATDNDLPHPAVLLLHMIGSNRASWLPLIPDLQKAGYHVLAVDLRGQGDTGGEINWSAATTDVQTWLDWLRDQPDVQPDAISIVGASIGANLALIGCANDDDCVTAIALSPGLVYYSLKPDINQLNKRSALLLASQNDLYSADSVKQMLSSATGDIAARLYSSSSHGTHLFEVSDKVRQGLIQIIVTWLDEHSPAGN